MPRYDWGPKKKANHYGLYAHLSAFALNNNMQLNGIKQSSTGFVNEAFTNGAVPNHSENEIQQEKL